MNDTPLIIHHGECNDGFTSAWIAHCHFTEKGLEPELFEGFHGDPIPIDKIDGRDVWILDFSYPREELLEAATLARSITVLDHHKTAENALRGLDDQDVKELLGLHVEFDMTRSGAMMTWEHFYPDHDAPKLVRYVQDRDLWKFELPLSREVSAYAKTIPRELEAWCDFEKLLEASFPTVVHAGASVLCFQERVVEQLCSFAEEITIEGHDVLIAPTPPDLRSEVAGALAEGRPFGVGWYLTPDGEEVWSLRSRVGGVNVREVAEALGGGGHDQAAGCSAPEALRRRGGGT